MYLVNSPVVRAETLKFREEGVRDVVSRVLLPWLNSFRFFLGQAALYQKDYNEPFQYDPHAKRSENVMDRWILARCQSLIKLVRQEMEGKAIQLPTSSSCLSRMETDDLRQHIAFTPSSDGYWVSLTRSPTGTLDSIENA